MYQPKLCNINGTSKHTTTTQISVLYYFEVNMTSTLIFLSSASNFFIFFIKTEVVFICKVTKSDQEEVLVYWIMLLHLGSGLSTL